MAARLRKAIKASGGIMGCFRLPLFCSVHGENKDGDNVKMERAQMKKTWL